MIFCSRRVFLNIVSQMMDLETLLNANYFLVDQAEPASGYHPTFGDDFPVFDQSGNLTFEHGSLDFSNKQARRGMHQYFIHYTRVFDSAPYFGMVAASIKNDYSTPEELFVNHLKNTDTQISVYQDIFQQRLNGNGLQILIMADDYGCQYFGDIICSYLSQLFGADITFIDPQYRPFTHGKIQYVGDKEYARKHIQWLRDMHLVKNVRLMADSITGSGYNNLEALFGSDDLTIEDLFHAHHVLFPDDQLPPGNYTKEHMKRMLIGRIMDSIGGNDPRRNLMEQMNMNMFAFDPMLQLYDNQVEEDFSNIT